VRLQKSSENLHALGYCHNDFNCNSIMLDNDSNIHITNFKSTRKRTFFASDIENFGRIMTELSPGELPEIYGNLAHKCRDDLDRPTAIELYKAFKIWCKCMDGNCKELSNYGIDIKRQFDKAGKEF